MRRGDEAKSDELRDLVNCVFGSCCNEVVQYIGVRTDGLEGIFIAWSGPDSGIFRGASGAGSSCGVCCFCSGGGIGSAAFCRNWTGAVDGDGRRVAAVEMLFSAESAGGRREGCRLRPCLGGGYGDDFLREDGCTRCVLRPFCRGIGAVSGTSSCGVGGFCIVDLSESCGAVAQDDGSSASVVPDVKSAGVFGGGGRLMTWTTSSQAGRATSAAGTSGGYVEVKRKSSRPRTSPENAS